VGAASLAVCLLGWLGWTYDSRKDESDEKDREPDQAPGAPREGAAGAAGVSSPSHAPLVPTGRGELVGSQKMRQERQQKKAKTKEYGSSRVVLSSSRLDV
jgi:hypothetical protein